ncbi:MAG: alpha/beta hydrolase [Candidatus Omnitrophica bacterium]|nr:alpha/beta hydrolase [Candidatus Omnitrophota bacterium]
MNWLKRLQSIFTRGYYSRRFSSVRAPSSDYLGSVRRIDNWRCLDGDDVSDDGHLIFLTPGHKTEKAIVFFHGHTNSPRQFAALGRVFSAKGYNVFIPRIPHHGLKDRMTQDHARLTAGEMVRMCDESVDIALGLGDKVTVVGFSMGANMSAWIGQNRSDVDKAVIIAPFWGWKRLPRVLFKVVTIFLSIWPNIFIWWDREGKKALIGPTSSYYRFSTRGVAQIMFLGWSVMEDAGLVAPKARAIVVISSAMDNTVNDNNLDQVVAQWQRHGSAQIKRYLFDASLGAIHDLIDPLQPYENIAVVYPKLIELIE